MHPAVDAAEDDGGPEEGKNDAARPTIRNGVPTDGKYLAMKLVIDGMAL